MNNSLVIYSIPSQGCKNAPRFGKIMTVHITDLPIKWTKHLMSFIFFTNIIIASTTNSNLSTFWALKNDKFSMKVWVIARFLTK